MDGYGPSSYGDAFADVYDDWYADVSDVDATVAGIGRLAEGDPVLELGVGTGRIAIPLARSGSEVVGVDASAAMLARLAAKPGGDRVTVVEADMAAPPLPADHFGVAFAAFNTFFNLTDEAAQLACLAAVASSLRPGGRLVIEGFVPPVAGLTDGGVSVREITADRAVLSASHHDAEGQTIRGHHIDISASGVRMRPWMLHYLTPDQLDERASRSGFSLERRHADWHGTEWTPDADVHVSVYRLDR